MLIKNTLVSAVTGLFGWHSTRRFVVFESDDWGSVRMHSREAFRYLKRKGYPVDECAYNRFDALETDADVEGLVEVLMRIRDSNGSHPVLTANAVVANPDFEAIRNSGFMSYAYETVDETLKRYPGRGRVMELYRKAMTEGVFVPQFHAREHVNVPNWMRALQGGNRAALDAFDFEMFSVAGAKPSSCHREFLDAFGAHSLDCVDSVGENIASGIKLFQKIWGRRATSLVPPCYIMPRQIEGYVMKEGIRNIKTALVQRLPVLGEPGRYQIKRRYTGQRNKLGQFYTIRNAFFEPSSDPKRDWVSACLADIETAFRWNKPAIISTHRLNFIGSLDPGNRYRNLKMLEELLLKILRRWPDVEFVSSETLGNLIDSDVCVE